MQRFGNRERLAGVAVYDAYQTPLAITTGQFAGASRELRDALMVNPYDTEQTAEAIRYGLEMSAKAARIP